MSGTKAVLQNQLQQALSQGGEDPNVLLFEISDIGKPSESKFEENRVVIERQMGTSVGKLGNKLEENKIGLEK